MSIIYALTSHDPKNYSSLKFNANPLIDSKIRYRIKSLSTYSCFSITTDDDYIIISRDSQETKYTFKDKSAYDDIPYELENIINNDLIPGDEGNEYHIYVSYNNNGMIKLTCKHKINIVDASHRVKMLLGLYHTTLPMKESNEIICESLPLKCFGNVLYLMSKSGIVIGTNEFGTEQYKNICYKSLELLVPGYPLVSKSPGYLMTIASEDMSQLEFQLVDFMMQPVILHAPLHLTLEVYYTGYDLVPINTNEFTYNNLAV